MQPKIWNILTYIFAIGVILNILIKLLKGIEIFGLTSFLLAGFTCFYYKEKKLNDKVLIIAIILIMLGYIEFFINL